MEEPDGGAGWRSRMEEPVREELSPTFGAPGLWGRGPPAPGTHRQVHTGEGGAGGGEDKPTRYPGCSSHTSQPIRLKLWLRPPLA